MPDGCSVEAAFEILVGKWKPVILFHLFKHETMKFTELHKAIPDITKKMLTAQLRELEYHDIVHRKIILQIPPKVEYSITEYGKKLRPLLQAINDWGMSHAAHMNELIEKSKSE
ncbi:helix-turn-helix domain-containing protein [Paenibacillus anseongense]|uniref:winged helix-turn-helix transcriptional regulator n=1 Tax=Paenibacillus TaxID=44249 RepID=UPI002DB6124C|nr:helix-turn-helix domain-containing protein [Paenibacillus anseongense]MEC0265510.1 helix-turn-helix domain-containing protein [Paenibacillus anseongense]